LTYINLNYSIFAAVASTSPFHSSPEREEQWPNSGRRGAGNSVRCRRTLESILGGNYLQLTARWEFGVAEQDKSYVEHAIIGAGDDGNVHFWSFTSDGKRSEGWLADVTDVHPEAVGFEADMPTCRRDART